MKSAINVKSSVKSSMKSVKVSVRSVKSSVNGVLKNNFCSQQLFPVIYGTSWRQKEK